MTFIISNENEKLKLGTIPSVRICQNMLEMALRCHHFAYKFLKFPGGGTPDPPNGRGGYPPSIPTPQSRYALLWCAVHTTIIFSNPPLLKPAYGPALIYTELFICSWQSLKQIANQLQTTASNVCIWKIYVLV